MIEKIIEKLERIESLLSVQKSVLNLKELSNYLGLSQSHIYKLTSEGKIPFYKPSGKNIYFDRIEIDKWIFQKRNKTQNEIEGEAIDYLTTKKGGYNG